MQHFSATYRALSLSVVAALLALAAVQGALADAGSPELEADCKDNSCGIEAAQDTSPLFLLQKSAKKSFALAGSKSAMPSDWPKVCHACAEWCNKMVQASEEHCMDPETADPESFENECAPAVLEECKGEESCVHHIICQSKFTCESWKVKNCQTTLEQSASNHGVATALQQRRAKARAHMPSLVSLESTTRGKCAE